MYKPNSQTHRRLFGSAALLVVIATLVGACGTTPPPGEPATSGEPATPAPSVAGATNAIATGVPTGTDALSVGPITGQPLTIDPTADFSLALSTSQDDDRSRARDQAGFAREVGPGWDALSTAADEATDAAAQAMADEFAIDIPTARRNALFASVVAPERVDPSQPASAAAALALLGAALAASQALGLGSLPEATVSESTTTTKGDSVATVTVNGTGTATVTGSRVVAEFSFDLAGTVSSIATGATAHMTGSATAHIEIDGCPDANGASKGKVTLSSSESVANGVGWTRDVTGDFDITVDDDANISRLTVDAQANESVEPSEQEPGDGEAETHGHVLGIGTHVEFAAGPGFSGMSHDPGKLGLEITHEENATSVDLGPLFTSALTSVVAGAHILGQAAERFWRDGKCIEVIVAPAGGDVDANSTTNVVAKVKHRFEGNELTKPVEATLAGVKSIDPEGQKQPAPATFIYTAGPKSGDKGELKFESVSNRGIGKKTVTFTVRSRDYRFDWTSPPGPYGPLHWQTIKCGGPEGRWVVEFDGTFDSTGTIFVVQGTMTFTVPQAELSGALSGTWTDRWTRTSGRDTYRGGHDVTMSGTGTFVPDPGPLLKLDYTQSVTYFDDSHRGTLPPGPPIQMLWPLESGSFCIPAN